MQTLTTQKSTSINQTESGYGAVLRLDNLCKKYYEGGKERRVLEHASLQVHPGEIVAILGKSGSGKTTLLNLVSGIDQVDCGDVYLGDGRLTGLDDTRRTLSRREKIGFIFQFFNLIPTLTVWENVLLPLELNHKDDEVGRRYAQDLLIEVGLGGREKTYPDRLSGGEQQRVAIARALVHNPVVVLADEPTGNLDEETGRVILALLDKLTRQSGKSLLLVTHSLEAAQIADRVFSLREGTLLAEVAPL
ncbi:MAG: ABC transporter ATP-binding protein [Anaerolineae bacterium]|nr:ABC transporter ATP-binding protein [Anaerolineae bacterium]